MNRYKIAVPASVQFWVEKNRCSHSPKNKRTGRIERDIYLECASGTGVTFYTIHQGGHAWPRGKKGSAWGDQPTREISATNLIWDFFANHPKQR